MDKKDGEGIFGKRREAAVGVVGGGHAVRIAHIALADKYAASIMSKAEQQLKGAEDVYRSGRDKKSVDAAAREVVETAEEARVMAVEKKGGGERAGPRGGGKGGPGGSWCEG